MLHLLCLLLVVQSDALPPAEYAYDPVQAADEFVARVSRESGIPGLVVGVVGASEVKYVRGFGVKTINTSDAIDENTITEIGSCSKTFIAMGLAYFVDKGIISWNTVVADIIPDFQTSDTYLTQNLNIGDLLAHRSGYDWWQATIIMLVGDLKNETELVTKRLKSLPVPNRLGLQFAYSNLGYEIATNALQNLAREPWFDFIKRRFLVPLGMHSTFASLYGDLTPTQKKLVSSGHLYVMSDPKGPSGIVTPFDLLESGSPMLPQGIATHRMGSGSIATSMSDYCKWMAFLLNPLEPPGIFDSWEALSQTQTAQMITFANWTYLSGLLNVTEPGNAFGATFGHDVSGAVFHGEHIFSKGGDSVYFKTRNGFLPERNLAVAVTQNMKHDPLEDHYINGIRNGLLDIFSGKSLETVNAHWDALSLKIESAKEMIRRSYEVVHMSVPLREGKAVNISYVSGDGPEYWMSNHALDIPQLDVLLKATHDFGLLPPAPLANYLGTFHDDFMGTLEVTASQDGRPVVHYGAVQGVLSWMGKNDPFGNAFLCANATRHTPLFTSEPARTTCSFSTPQKAALFISLFLIPYL
ncbi:hypothetical protein CYMTET_25717 [Cymbomonas tetramitiformis]|uniref:Beta-lactamase-related domain-containing protein n=1 Tax=Cymbomonas tetramitiformis TaxID=36881 RepID=A0AAE0KYY6_9CHLO|nr:hypothetical protein CYMTET_25717 [Cymbomonas tetramitiformis]